jgi:neurobeachin-like protein 1/2
LKRTKKSIAGPFDPNFEINSKIFILTHDAKLLISGGHWDNSLRVFSLTKYKNISQIYQHSSNYRIKIEIIISSIKNKL